MGDAYDFRHWPDGEEIPPCFSCSGPGRDYPADIIALTPHVDGGGKVAFAAPLCRSHAQLGLVAGWFPQHDIRSDEGRKAWDDHGIHNPKRRIKP